jgi:hypothetical protein
VVTRSEPSMHAWQQEEAIGGYAGDSAHQECHQYN